MEQSELKENLIRITTTLKIGTWIQKEHPELLEEFKEKFLYELQGQTNAQLWEHYENKDTK